MDAWQRCRAAGLSTTEFTHLIDYVPALELLPDDKTWLIPLCVIEEDRICRMRFLYPSLDEFVELIHNRAMSEIREVLTKSVTIVDPWMGLLREDSGLESMDAIMHQDWNLEKPVIALSALTLRRRARDYLLAVATSDSIKILYTRTMVGPVSVLKMDEYNDRNFHELLTRVWHEFRKSVDNGNIREV